VDLAQRNSPLDSSEQALFEHHLKQTVLGTPDHADAHRMLGELYLQQRKFEQALPHLHRAVRGHPAALLTLVQVYRVLGRQAQASGAAKQASARFQALAEAEPDKTDHRRLWAQSQLLLAHHERAAKILLEGLAGRDANKPADRPAVQELCQALSAVYVSWFDAVSRSSLKKVSGTVVPSRAPTEGWSRAVPATVPDTFLNPSASWTFPPRTGIWESAQARMDSRRD
jgi:tetratricopeptide (TPR) repeat protein